MSVLDDYLKEHRKEAYSQAELNTMRNNDGKAIIESGDEWEEENEWDDDFRTRTEEMR